MNTWIRRGVVALTALGTVVGSLAMGVPSAGAVVPAPNPPTNLTVYKQGTSTASATALDVLDVAIASASSPYLPINTTNGNPRLEFSKSGNRTVYVAVTATGATTGTAVLPVLPEAGLWHVNLLVNNIVNGGLNFTYTPESWTCAVGEPATDGTNKFCEQRFTASGTWTVPTDVTSVDFLVVGAGGGGGGGLTYNSPPVFGAGAGGGGGEVKVCANQTVVPGNQWTVTVGSGGAAGVQMNGGQASPGANGGASSIVLPAEATCSVAGGLGGESAGIGSSGGPSRVVHVVTPLPRGVSSVTGGGGGASGNSNAGGAGASSLSNGLDRTVAGGGGGGSGAVGSNGSDGSPALGGAGGAGTNPTGSFADLVYTFGGGGGGGAGDEDGTDGTGGRGWYGGGNGGTCSSGTCSGGYEASDAGNAPVANSGGGGGGGTGSASGTAAAGADGVVIVRWAAPQTATLYVHQTNTIGGGSCASPDFATIAGAIAAAATGDTIVVCSGTYQEGALAVPSAITELTIKGEVYPALGNPTVFPAVGPQAGAPILDGRNATTPSDDSLRVRILDAPSTFLHLENLTFQYGSSPEETTATAGGGGVRANRLSLDHASFTHNEATRCADGGCGDYLDRGGAVLAIDAAPANTEEAPTVDIDSSTFDDNAASLAGGAVASSGYVLVNESAFDGNSVSNSDIFAYGGAISTGATDNSGNIVSDAPVTAISSSFTNNSIVKIISETGSFGSAIAAGGFQGGGDLLLINSTVAGNTAEAGYAATLYGSNVFVRFSTVVNNTLTGSATAVFVATSSIVIGGSLFTSDGGDVPCEVAQTYVDLGSNVTDISNCLPNPTTQVVANVAAMKLGTIGEQGTAGTKSYPLQADSPAVDSADCDLSGVLLSAIDVDQNGTVRPQGTDCDAGAVERVRSTGRVWIERGGAPVTAGNSCGTPAYTSITDAVTDAQADDIIHVCSGTYREEQIVPTVDNLTILGEEYPADSGNETIIDGELTSGDTTTRHRIFDATGLEITFENVTLQNGSSDTYGGAVKAYQAVFVDSTVQDNRAPGGGAVYVSGQPACVSPISRFLPGPRTLCAPTRPMGPVSEPSVTVTGSEFLRNGVAALGDAPVLRGAAYSGGSIDGGAVYANAGTVTVTDSTFEANEALITNVVPLATDGAGGAIIADSVEVYGSTFTGNKALYHGGAIAAASVTVRASTTGGAPVATVFDSNAAAGDVAGDGYGGAIWADGVDVANASFVSNAADNGGAIASAVQQDQAPVVPSTALTPATVTIEASTFEDNSATADGGAVLNKAVSGSTTVYNSTFSANDARNAGGAVYAQDALTVSFSTFDANTAGVAGGVFWTPVAPSVDDNIFSFVAADEAEAARNGCLTYEWTPVKDTKNFTTNYWCPGTVVASADLGLSSLADNGGPTKTIAIDTTSAALDVADQTECDSRTDPADQRGVARAIGVACDVGAFEYYGEIDLGAGGQDPGVHTLTVPDDVSTVYALLVGGGGPGGNSNDDEATGGGGGGEVKECAVTVSPGDVVTYRIGEGGTDGDWGGSSWVAINYSYDPFTFDPNDPAIKCYAAGGENGKSASGDPRAIGGASGNSNLGGAGLCPEPCVAGGGGGGAGSVGTPGLEEPVRGGAGGAGVSPSAAFGDISTVFGGGGGGGATGYFCLAVTAGAGGAGGGGAGAEESLCDSGAPVSPGSYAGTDSADGTDGTGGGGGGAGGSYGPGEGGSGTAAFRIPVSIGGGGPTLPEIHVCVHRTSVTYGKKLENLDVDYCVPVGECFPAPSTSGGGSTGPSGPSGATGPWAPVSGSDPNHDCCPAPVAPVGLQGPVSGTDPECCPTSGPVGSDDPNHCTPAAPVDSDPVPASPSVSGSLFGPMSADGTVVATDSPDLVYSEQAQQWVGSAPTADGPSAPDATAPVTTKKKDGLPDGYYEIEPEKIEELYGVIPPDCTVPYTVGDPVSASPLTITCTGGDAGPGYTFDYSLVDAQEFNILPAELKVKPNEVKVSFGDPVPTYLFKVRGFKLHETPDTADGWSNPVCTSTYTDTTPAGTKLDITCSGGSADNYVFKYETGRLEVRKKKIRLAPQDRTVTYGDPAPSYGFTLAPLDGGTGRLPERLDQPQQLAGFVAPVCSSSYAKGTSAGTVAITCTGGGADNYEFDTSNAGSLTVLKAPLSVQPKAVSVTYGTTTPSYAFDLAGFVNGDTAPGSGYRAPTCSSAYSPTVAAGTALLVTCTGGVSNNYSLDLSSTATLTVAKAKLTVTPDAKALVYGSPAPVYSYKVSGFVNGESPLTNPAGYTAPSCSSAYAPTVPAGSSVAISCTGGSASNYTVDTSATAAVNVGKAVLSVVPDAKSVVYGSAAPSYTATVSGFVNGESAAVLSVQPVCTSAYTSATNVGTVAITCSGGTSGNYAFDTTAKGTLTVTKAVLKATPTAASVVYGSAAPTVGVTVTGFVNGQSATTAAGFKAPTCSAAGYTMASNVGSYAITCAAGSATNYSFDVSASSLLTVTKAAATVTADSKSVVYGTANPGWTFTLSGLKNSQTAATVAGLVAPTCVSTYTVTTAAGSVPAITCSGGSSTNYSFTYVAGKATVTKATLVVTPDAKSILKGSAIPAYTFTVAGYVNGQTASVLTAQPKCASSYTTRSAVGSYTISCSGAAAANYTVTYKTATLTVR